MYDKEKRNARQRAWRHRTGRSKTYSGGGRPGRPVGRTVEPSVSQQQVAMFRERIRGESGDAVK